MAGGQGTRGRPYTEYFPKAMTPICDKPLIDHIIRYVQSFEFVDGVIVISDYNGLGGQILNYYGACVWTGSKTVADMSCDGGVMCGDIYANASMHDKIPASRIATDVVFVQDSQSGTGGDLLHISELIPDGEPFVLWFVDNLCAIDLYGMRGRFEEYGSAACIATRKRRAEATGFAILAENGCTVRRFEEKPVMNLPSSECLGVYILDKSILGRISDVMKKKRKKSVYASSKVNDHTPKKERWTRLNSDDDNHGNDNSTATLSTPIQVNLSHDILEDLSGEENDNGSVSAFDIGDSEWVDVESPAILERHKSKISSILDAMKHMAK